MCTYIYRSASLYRYWGRLGSGSIAGEGVGRPKGLCIVFEQVFFFFITFSMWKTAVSLL